MGNNKRRKNSQPMLVDKNVPLFVEHVLNRGGYVQYNTINW